MADAAEKAVPPTGGLLRRQNALQRIVFVALGVLLLVTAGLKAQGLSNGALGQNTILFSPRLRFLTIETEAVLGLWLLSGWARRTAWFFAVVFFVMVSGVSLYLGLMGQSSCGCFGRIHVSPWSAFTLDVACLAALGLCRPSFRQGQGDDAINPQQLREVFTIVGGVGAILAVCLGGVLLAGGSHPGDFLARVRGDRITVEPPVTDMGSGVAGQRWQFTVRLHNYTDHTVKIVGGMVDCSCSVIEDLPVSVPPGGSVPVTVRARFTGTTGMFQQGFYFYTDEGRQKRVLARFKGRIIDPSSSQSK